MPIFERKKHYWLFRNPIQIKPDLRGVLELIEISTTMKEGELYQYIYIRIRINFVGFKSSLKLFNSNCNSEEGLCRNINKSEDLFVKVFESDRLFSHIYVHNNVNVRLYFTDDNCPMIENSG